MPARTASTTSRNVNGMRAGLRVTRMATQDAKMPGMSAMPLPPIASGLRGGKEDEDVDEDPDDADREEREFAPHKPLLLLLLVFVMASSE
jgi:hypothetical protein